MKKIKFIALMTMFGLLFAGFAQAQIEKSSASGADRIIYHFGDRTVSPEYHRSYTITVTKSTAKIVVDSYGKNIAESVVKITAADFKKLMKAVQAADLKKVKTTEQGGCTGGTSENIAIYRNQKILFKAGVYHCGGMDMGELSGDIGTVKTKMSSFFPDFEQLISRDVPRS